jgi:hypothetical protein
MNDVSKYGDATIAFLIEQEQKREKRYCWASREFNRDLLYALYREEARRRIARMDPEDVRRAEEFAEDDHG